MKVKFSPAKRTPHLIIPVFIPHLGCTHRCLFCNQSIVTSSRVIHTEDIKKIVHSYLSWKSKKRKKIELSFYGGSFTALPEKTMKEYIKTGEKFIDKNEVDCLRCSTRPDAISSEKANYLKAHSFHTVELGVQSFSDRLLSEMKRGHDSNSVIKAFHILKEKGLSVCYQFMTGFPGETLKDVEISIETLKKHSPDFVRIYPFAPLSGAPVTSAIKEGRYPKPDFKTAIDHAADIYAAALDSGSEVIRTGLPLYENKNPWYPDNLAQIVVKRMLEREHEKGRLNITIPERFISSFYSATKTCPEITRFHSHHS